MITDITLLSELHELSGTRVQEYLEELRDKAIAEMIDAPNDRAASIASGKARVLKSLIEDIETAYDRAVALRNDAATKKTVDMKKAF